MRRWRRKRKCNLTAILLLGLLPWVEPASAEVVHTLRVSVHKEVRPTLTPAKIEGILKKASDLMKRPNINGCPVEFKLGSVQPLAAPARIDDEATLEAVHSVDADVKVVQTITFCKGKYNKEGFWGCAWRPEGRPKTVIVTNKVPSMTNLRHILWAHEFGHTTGLEHRVRDRTELLEPLMTACGFESFSVLIKMDECNCFRAGPGNKLPECIQPDQELKCPSDRRRRPLTD